MGIRDKGEASGAFLHQSKEVIDVSTGNPIASMITTLMLRGDGGCGDYDDAAEELQKLPDRVP